MTSTATLSNGNEPQARFIPQDRYTEAIRVRDLSFRYPPKLSLRNLLHRRSGRGKLALEDINFSVKKGEVFGLLGTNGAGKTTLIKILSTVLLHQEGTVRVLGHDLPRAEAAVRSSIGVALGEYGRTFHHRLTGRDNLRYFASFNGLTGGAATDRIDHLLEKVGLTHAGDQDFREYSTGMKHRLAIARALLPDPEILILDEPTAGLDAQSTEDLSQLVRGLTSEDRTTIYTTHRLEEAGSICDRILILSQGRQVAMAAPHEIRRMVQKEDILEATLDASPNGLRDALSAVEGVRRIRADGTNQISIHVNDVGATLEPVVSMIRQHDRRVVDIRSRTPSIEDAFVELTGGRR